MAQWISLESMLASGLAVAASGFAILLTLFSYWTRHGYTTIGTVLPAVTGTTLIVVGAQNILGGFLLAIINGHEAEFLKEKPESAPQLTKPSISWQEFPRAASR
jgi:mannose/fructose/N-acetylgalactosamine-specific phosphotransferase system component IIC